MNDFNQREQAMYVLADRVADIIHKIIEDNNPELYKTWGRNACRQTAVFVSAILKKQFPDYVFRAYDGWFKDSLNGRPVEYNHAWILATQKANHNRMILIDMARIVKDKVFMLVERNAYPKDLRGFEDMEEVKREKLNWEKMVKEEYEYYTHFSGKEFIGEIEKRLK